MVELHSNCVVLNVRMNALRFLPLFALAKFFELWLEALCSSYANVLILYYYDIVDYSWMLS